MKSAVLLALLLPAAPAAARGPEIGWDKRVDLVGILGRLTSGLPDDEDGAAGEAARRFAPWRKHAAVRRLKEMRARGFSGDLLPQYAVYLSTGGDYAEVYETPPLFATMAGGPELLEAWRSELAGFAAASGFDAWEDERAPLREKELEGVRLAAGDKDIETPLVRLLGVKPWDRWTVVVSPFYPSRGGAAWVLEQKPGLPDVFVIYGPEDPRWRLEPWDFAATVWPEAIFAAAYSLYEACRSGFTPRADACRGYTLTSLEDCVQAHWVWAVRERLIREVYGPDARLEQPGRFLPPYREEVSAALDAWLASRSRKDDLLSAAGALAAPLAADGRAPSCAVPDESRKLDQLYAQRVGYFLEARLKARRDPKASRILEELAPRRPSPGR